MHDAYTIGIPVLAILLGILWNGQQTRDLRGEINSLRTDMGSLRKELHADMENLRKELHADIESMRSDIHADLRALNQISFAHETRITALEGKVKP